MRATRVILKTKLIIKSCLFIISLFQAQSTQVIRLRRLRQQILQVMKRIKNSARCRLLNLSIANLPVNKCNFSLQVLCNYN